MTKAQSQDIIINGFQRGVGDSPYVGFGRMQNLDIWTYPGIAKIKLRQVLSFTPVGLPTAIVKYNNPSSGGNNVFVGTDQGYVYKDGVLLNNSNSSAVYDMKVWNNYLFITRNLTMDVYGPLDNISPFYQSNWNPGTGDTLSLAAGFNKPIVPLTGGSIVYVGNSVKSGVGNNIGTITSFVAGTNSTAPTATFNAGAIPLQYGEYCRTLALLGRNLLIGTQGGSSFTDVAVGVANIYPYDLGTLTLGTAIPLSENGINQMWVQGNTCYIHAGIYGNIYQTNGSSVTFYKRIPINRTQGSSFFPYPNAIGYVNNELLVGTSTGGSANSTDVNGIYSFRGTATNFKTISTGDVGSTNILKIGAILPQGPDALLIGWQSGATYGVDTVDTNVYTNFLAFLESEVFIVAEPENTENFDDIIVYLTSPLTTGQQIRLSYRDGQGAYTVIKTLDSTMAPLNSTALFCKSLINNVNTVQIKCEFNQPAPSVYGSNIPFLGIKIKNHNG